MSELEEAILLANRVLDRPGYADPDDDLAILSRQLLRSQERLEAARKTVKGLERAIGMEPGYEGEIRITGTTTKNAEKRPP